MCFHFMNSTARSTTAARRGAALAVVVKSRDAAGSSRSPRRNGFGVKRSPTARYRSPGLLFLSVLLRQKTPLIVMRNAGDVCVVRCSVGSSVRPSVRSSVHLSNRRTHGSSDGPSIELSIHSGKSLPFRSEADVLSVMGVVSKTIP